MLKTEPSEASGRKTLVEGAVLMTVSNALQLFNSSESKDCKSDGRYRISSFEHPSKAPFVIFVVPSLILKAVLEFSYTFNRR
ncbi:MAG: hypothetical protein ACLVI9_02575 [Anaerostipes hadrus]